jgi:hypothetical protein
MAFSARNPIKLAQEQCVMISCTELYQNRSRIMKCTCRNALTYLKTVTKPISQALPSLNF